MLVYFDFETTGVDSTKHGIHQVAFIFEKNGRVIDKYKSAVNPPSDIKIDEEALRVSNTSKKELSNFPDEEEVRNKVVSLFKQYSDEEKLTPVAFNAEFDLKFLRQLYKRSERPMDKDIDITKTLDPMALYSFLTLKIPPLKNTERSLEGIGKVLEIAPNGPLHDAMTDTKLARNVMGGLYGQIDNFIPANAKRNSRTPKLLLYVNVNKKEDRITLAPEVGGSIYKYQNIDLPEGSICGQTPFLYLNDNFEKNSNINREVTQIATKIEQIRNQHNAKPTLVSSGGGWAISILDRVWQATEHNEIINYVRLNQTFDPHIIRNHIRHRFPDLIGGKQNWWGTNHPDSIKRTRKEFNYLVNSIETRDKKEIYTKNGKKKRITN